MQNGIGTACCLAANANARSVAAVAFSTKLRLNTPKQVEYDDSLLSVCRIILEVKLWLNFFNLWICLELELAERYQTTSCR